MSAEVASPVVHHHEALKKEEEEEEEEEEVSDNGDERLKNGRGDDAPAQHHIKVSNGERVQFSATLTFNVYFYSFENSPKKTCGLVASSLSLAPECMCMRVVLCTCKI